MSELIEHDRFEIEFPVWSIVDIGKFSVIGLPKALTVLIENGENYIPIFTDIDLASRFVEDAPLPGKGPHCLDTPQELLAILNDFKRLAKGKNVGIDLLCKPRITGRFWPIDEAIEMLQNAH